MYTPPKTLRACAQLLLCPNTKKARTAAKKPFEEMGSKSKVRERYLMKTAIALIDL
jgi:hypothetical protein